MTNPALGLLAALLIPLQASAGTLTGHVVGVTDGDTITLLDSSKEQHKIRLAGIDAPEKEQSPADRDLYAAAENAARAKRVGLWSDAAPVAPWDFRKMKREGNE